MKSSRLMSWFLFATGGLIGGFGLLNTRDPRLFELALFSLATGGVFILIGVMQLRIASRTDKEVV